MGSEHLDELQMAPSFQRRELNKSNDLNSFSPILRGNKTLNGHGFIHFWAHFRDKKKKRDLQ